MSNICCSCNSNNLVIDSDNSYLVCTDCGTVNGYNFIEPDGTTYTKPEYVYTKAMYRKYKLKKNMKIANFNELSENDLSLILNEYDLNKEEYDKYKSFDNILVLISNKLGIKLIQNE